MRSSKLSVLAALAASLLCTGASAQDVLANHRVAALRGLVEAKLIFRPATDSEIMGVKECMDILRIALARNSLELKLDPKEDASSTPWLELALASTEKGASVTLTLYRWVRLEGIAASNPLFAPVWTESIYGFGRATRGDIEDSIRALANSFSAEMLRATAK